MAVNPNVINITPNALGKNVGDTLPDHKQISRIVGDMLVADGVVSRQTIDDTLALLEGKDRSNTVFLVLAKHGLLTREVFLDVVRNRQPDLPLGSLLTELGLIDQPRLQQLLEQQAHDYYQHKLGELLVRNGLLKEQELTQIVAAQIGLESEEPDPEHCDEEILKTISAPTCKRFSFAPVRRDNDKVLVVFADPLDQQARTAAARMLGCAIDAKMASKTTIARILNAATDPLAVEDEEESGLSDLPASFLNSLIASALTKRATHIHIEPRLDHSRVLMRIQGQLIEVSRLKRSAHAVLVTRVKTRINVDASMRNQHLFGNFEYTNSANEVEASVNVSLFVSIQGESLVLRVNQRQEAIPSLEALDLKRSDLKSLRRMLDQVGGIILVTGPADSGKSHTLYSAIQYLNQNGKKVVSIENTIKMSLDGVVQCDLNTRAGINAGTSLHFALSQDPDALVFGEMKDKELAIAASEVALSGTKVLTSFKSEDCLAVLNRIADINPLMLRHSSTDITLIAQRLLRKVCTECAVDLPANEVTLTELGWSDTSGSFPSFREGRGCAACQQSGYAGRFAVFEVAPVNEDVRQGIANHVTSAALRDTMKKVPGYTSLKESAFLAAVQGMTTLEQIKRHFSGTERIRALDDLLGTL